MASAAAPLSPLHRCVPPPASSLDARAGKGESHRVGEEPSAGEPFHGEPRAPSSSGDGAWFAPVEPRSDGGGARIGASEPQYDDGGRSYCSLRSIH
jgi:hypothetical protein